MLGWLELACPTACTCLFKLRPGVLSKTLSHIWVKLNLPIFLFSVGLFTLINKDSLIPMPLVGKPPHHFSSTQDFVEQVKNVTLLPGECLSSYDVTALFTSVPVDPALGIIKDLL